MNNLLLVLLTLGLGSVRAGAAGPQAPASVAASTGTAAAEVAASTETTVQDIYPVENLRDPFVRWGKSSGGAKRPFSMADFDIHRLFLRGIMKDSGSEFALFVDEDAGVSFLLRKGHLYDPKRKIVPGISGAIDIKRKTATLRTADGDEQPFRMGSSD
jgi:hypothetical protein